MSRDDLSKAGLMAVEVDGFLHYSSRRDGGFVGHRGGVVLVLNVARDACSVTAHAL